MRALLLALALALVAPFLSAAEETPAQQTKALDRLITDKGRTLSYLDKALAEEDERLESMLKSKEKLDGQSKVIEDAKTKLTTAKQAMQAADDHLESSAQRVLVNNQWVVTYDPAAIRAQGEATHAYQQIKRDTYGVDDAAVTNKAALDRLDQQIATLTAKREKNAAEKDKVAKEIDEAKAKLAALDGAPAPAAGDKPAEPAPAPAPAPAGESKQ